MMANMSPLRAMPALAHDRHDWDELLAWCRRKLVAAHSNPRSVKKYLEDRWPRRLARKAAALSDTELIDLFERALPLMREAFPEDFQECRDAYFAKLREDVATGELLVDLIAASPGMPEEQLVREAMAAGRKNVRMVLESVELVDRLHRREDALLYPGRHRDLSGSGGPALSWEGASLRKEQRDYAQRFFDAFQTDEPLPLRGQIGYLYLTLQKLCGEDPASEQAAVIYRRVIRHYAGTAGESIGGELLAGYFFARGEIETAISLAHLFPETLAGWLIKFPSLHLKVEHLSAWGRQSENLTNVGAVYKEEIQAEIQRRLDEHHSIHGVSMLRSWYLEGRPFPENSYEHPLFHRVATVDPQPSILIPDVHRSNVARFEDVIVDLVRDAENEVRLAHGLPRIGEMWTSEIALLAIIRDAFRDEEVQHQGRPAWLGRQSFDIYLPNRQIAVEYQGIQHDRPVERFGGEIAFQRQQERDERKRDLCRSHGVTLLEVRPGYDPAEVLDRLRASAMSMGS